MHNNYRGHRRAEQLIDFTNMSYDGDLNPGKAGLIRAGDIDGCLELHNSRSHILQIEQGFLFLELKLNIAEMDYGQETMYKKLAEYTAKGGAVSYVAELVHHTFDSDKDIDAAKSYVRRYYSGADLAWHNPKRAITAKEFQDLFVEELKTGKKIEV